MVFTLGKVRQCIIELEFRIFKRNYFIHCDKDLKLSLEIKNEDNMIFKTNNLKYEESLHLDERCRE